MLDIHTPQTASDLAVERNRPVSAERAEGIMLGRIEDKGQVLKLLRARLRVAIEYGEDQGATYLAGVIESIENGEHWEGWLEGL